MDIESYNSLEIGNELFVIAYGFSGNFIIVGIDESDTRKKYLVQLESSPEAGRIRTLIDCMAGRVSLCSELCEDLVDYDEAGFWVSADDVVRIVNRNGKKAFWRL